MASARRVVCSGSAAIVEHDDALALISAGVSFATGAAAASSDPATDPDVLWANYQEALASDEGEHEISSADQAHALAYSENEAAYNDAKAVDQANEECDATIAGDQKTEQDAEANATHDMKYGLAVDDYNKAVNDAKAWQYWNDGLASTTDVFDYMAFSLRETYYNTLADDAQTANDGMAGVEYDLAQRGADGQALSAAFNAIMQTWRDQDAQAVHDYSYKASDGSGLDFDNVARGKGLTCLEEHYIDALACDLKRWLQTNDADLGADEIAVGAALAQQDEDDTAARDQADETAANQAATEVDMDAPQEQLDNDDEAGFQETQDIADAEAQQTYEDGVSDNYVNILQAWANSPLPPGEDQGEGASSLEQYQQAVADDAWVHSDTEAEVTDVEEEDGAQVTWAKEVDSASEQQTVDDADAMAAAIVASDEADAAHATAVDTAWATEAKALANANTAYDQADACITADETMADEKALHKARNAWDQALGVLCNAEADIQLEIVESNSSANAGAEEAAAAATQVGADAGAAVQWAETCATNEQQYVEQLADAKGGTTEEPDTGWVAGITDAEADYVAAAATAGAVETQSDADAAATMDGAIANDRADFEIALAGANVTRTTADGTAQETLTHAQAVADAANAVGYSQADANYQEAIWTDYAALLQSLVPNAQPPSAESILAQYYASVAEVEAQQTIEVETALVSEDNQVSQADIALSNEMESAFIGQVDTDASANASNTETVAPEEASAISELAVDAGDWISDDAVAQAAYAGSVANAMAQFYKDKAVASNTYDVAVADAGNTWVDTTAPEIADYTTEVLLGEPITIDIMGDLATAGQARALSVSGARGAEISSYGDAEVTEATSIGEAQVTLATAQGDDEVALANQKLTILSTLGGDIAQADNVATAAIDNAAAENGEEITSDTAGWTSAADTNDQSTEEQVDNDKSTAVGGIAGAQADYAIAQAQIGASSAAGLAQANPGGQTEFDFLYAEGYVQWLTDLKPAFVANATAMSQASGQYDVDLMAATGALDAAMMTAANDFNTEDSPALATEQTAIGSDADAYTASLVDDQSQRVVGTANADSTQSVDLAKAAAAYILACAQADKQEAIDEFNLASDTSQNYKIALADAKLALDDSQADADLAWVDGQAAADESFMSSDAGAWQATTGGNAEAVNQFAHTDDAAMQSEQDAIGAARAEDLTAEATADQTEGNSDALAATTFASAEANETATIWNWLAGQLGNTPWAQSQAGIAGAEATWATTAGTNYRQYVVTLGTDETGYAASDAGQLTTAVKAIDAADRTDSDKAADALLTVTDSLAADEAIAEQATGEASQTYQGDMAQANHDYRYAAAQATHDLIVSGDEAAYAGEMTVAADNLAAGDGAAVSAFEVIAGPATTAQTTADADAQLIQAKAQADASLDDTIQYDQAIDGYTKAESGDYDARQKADAQALHDYQLADANGHAAAIANLDQANPSPWSDLAATQATALGQQQVADADAQLAQANAVADAQAAAEQAQADAQQAQNDSDAQAEHDQAGSTAQAAHDGQVAQANVADDVFALLPDVLAAPADGTPPTLTPDYVWGYEANDFYLYPTTTPFGESVSEFGIGWETFAGVPDYAMQGITLGVGQYFSGYSGGMELGLLGDTPGPWQAGPFVEPPSAARAPVNGLTYDNPIVFAAHDMVRGGLPETADYQTPTHMGNSLAMLLLVADPTGTEAGGDSGSINGNAAADAAQTAAVNAGVPNHPSLKLDADGNIIAIDGQAIAPTSMEFLHDNYFQLWLAIQRGDQIKFQNPRREPGQHSGLGGTIEGIYAASQPGGGVKSVTGPAPSNDKRAISKRDQETLRDNDKALDAVEGTLKGGKQAGEVADAILIGRAVGKFAIRQGMKYAGREAAKAAPGAAPAVADAAAKAAKAEAEAQAWLMKLTGEVAAVPKKGNNILSSLPLVGG